MAEKKTKIDIFSGFLGAGKTTLIKKLIKEAFAGEQIVLIENEFGEIGIDGGFMREAGIQVNELNSGCICCSLVGDFREALKKVVETYHPDRILIEPSGVGKLSDVIVAVQRTVDECPELKLNSYVTVADASKVKVYMKNFGEFYNNQIEAAGTIILSMSVLIWFLSGYNAAGPVEDMSDSFLAAVGGWMSALFIFHGFDTWEAGSAVISGIMAKEAVVSTIGILYGLPDLSPDMEEAEMVTTVAGTGLAAAFTAASALAFMVFSQLYTPCMTALGTIKKETNSWYWMGFAAVSQFVIAWAVSLVVYRIALALGL